MQPLFRGAFGIRGVLCLSRRGRGTGTGSRRVSVMSLLELIHMLLGPKDYAN